MYCVEAHHRVVRELTRMGEGDTLRAFARRSRVLGVMERRAAVSRVVRNFGADMGEPFLNLPDADQKKPKAPPGKESPDLCGEGVCPPSACSVFVRGANCLQLTSHFCPQKKGSSSWGRDSCTQKTASVPL